MGLSIDLSSIDVNRGLVPKRTQGNEGFDLTQLLQQMAEGGFTDDQFQQLMLQLSQQIAGQQRAAAPIRRQSLAGQPAAVRASATASAGNQALQAQQRGVSAIQTAGIGNQITALQLLLQQQQGRDRLKSQRQSNLLGVLGQLGGGVGGLLTSLLNKPKTSDNG